MKVSVCLHQAILAWMKLKELSEFYMHEIILIGAGGHANSCIDVIELSGKFKIAGLLENNKTRIQKNLGYPIIGTDDDLENIRNNWKQLEKPKRN